MARNKHNAAGIASMASYPIVVLPSNNDGDNDGNNDENYDDGSW